MAWNEPGGGRDPWGGRKDDDNGNNQGPPDLDEVIRRFQQRLKQWLGGSGDGGGGSAGGPGGGIGAFGVVLILLVGAGLWLSTGFYIVEPAERGVELRFGEFKRLTTAGPHWHLPYPIETHEIVNVDSIRDARHKGLMLTRDENIVNVDVVTQYRVSDPKDFLFNVRAPESTLRDAMISAVREVVGRNKMDFILGEGRSEVANNTRELLSEVLAYYGTGIEVTSVNMQDAQPPEQVQPAFEDAIKAREDKQRIINEAVAYANAILPTARGQAARRAEEAEGYRQERVAQAQGEADRFVALVQEYRQAPDVTRQRLYLETIEQILGNNPKVLVNDKGDGRNLFYIPLDRLSRGKGGDQSNEGRSVPPQLPSLAAELPKPGDMPTRRSDERTRERR